MGHNSLSPGKLGTPGRGLTAKALRERVGKRYKGTQRTRKLTTVNAPWSWRNGSFLSTSLSREPYEAKVCAVSRTDGIATRGGRSSGSMTPRRTTHLDPKGRGDKSMLVKRGTAEDVYAVVLQRLSDRAKTALFEPQSPGVEPHTRR